VLREQEHLVGERRGGARASCDIICYHLKCKHWNHTRKQHKKKTLQTDLKRGDGDDERMTDFARVQKINAAATNQRCCWGLTANTTAPLGDMVVGCGDRVEKCYGRMAA
jgi:hypothetical protein